MFSAIRAPWKLRSVPGRLTFWYLWTLGASLTSFAVFVFVMRASTLYRELDADLKVRVHQLASDFRPALLGLDLAHDLAARAGALEAPVLVRAAPDRILFRSPSFPQLDWAGERRLAGAARDGSAITTIEDYARVPMRIATLVVNRPGADPLAIQVAASTAPVQRILGQLTGAMILAILVVLGIASFGSTSTARRALAPVDEIVRRVREIQASSLNERLNVQAGSEELDRLVATLNDMLDRIAASVVSARRFAADASHELQTPLAAMRAAIETCLREERPRDEYQAMGADVLGEIERLSVLVRDLRLLALAEAGRLVTTADAIDLAGITAECCEVARAIAEEKHIQIECRFEARPVLIGSALHLRRAVLNLAENAIRYSPASSTVAIDVAAGDGEAIVAVADHGCGIDEADLPHIFEPFYRADPARARDTGGTGLGLAIAREVVRAHGGRIAVASRVDEGTTFTIHLPIQSPGLPVSASTPRRDYEDSRTL